MERDRGEHAPDRAEEPEWQEGAKAEKEAEHEEEKLVAKVAGSFSHGRSVGQNADLEKWKQVAVAKKEDV